MKLGELRFLDTNEECLVCMENVFRKLLWPCGHSFCISCSRNLLNPVDFGAPHCPNGCENPSRGKQCYCDEYDPILENWENEFPDQYERWNTAEDLSIHNSGDGTCICPLCRIKWNSKCLEDFFNS
jgi:hypothetical protein